MNENPTILRPDTGDPAPLAPSLEEGDPILASGARKRIAALAVLVASAYSIVVPLDLAIQGGIAADP